MTKESLRQARNRVYKGYGTDADIEKYITDPEQKIRCYTSYWHLAIHVCSAINKQLRRGEEHA